MKLEEIKTLARLHSISVNRVKKADLVRAIQKAEWNQPCFETGSASSCGQAECLWREDCR